MKALKSLAAVAAMAIVLSACSDDSALVRSGMEDASLKTVQDGAITFSNANPLMVADALAKGGKAGKVALCHADQDTGVLHRIDVSGNAAGSHLENHVGDGLIGSELNADAMVLYDESCEPLSPPLTELYREDFNGLLVPATGPRGFASTGAQCGETGKTVIAFADLPGWSKGGINSIHGVEWEEGNIAVTLIDTNVYTMATTVAANEPGVTYQVDFLGSPAVWGEPVCWQATGHDGATGDGLLFQILSGNAEVASHIYYPPAWAGNENNYQPASFSYTGNGSGPIRVRISDYNGGGINRFGGGVDDLVISKVN